MGFRSVLTLLGLSSPPPPPEPPPPDWPLPPAGPSGFYELHLRLYSRAGVLKNAFLQPLWARYTDSVQGIEPLVFALNEDNPAVADIADFDIMEVMIRNKALGLADSGGFVRAFVGIVRHSDMATDDDGLTFRQFICPNEKSILAWRHVLWPAGVANRSAFTSAAAETIMKTIVQYNLTASATTANGRHRAGNLLAGMGLDVQIATDQARGESLSLAIMGGNVLDVLRRVSDRGGGDFSLRWQGGNEWLFEFHPNQLGLDKSSGSQRVLFSLANNTMSRPRLRRSGAAATVALAAGQGEGADRAVSVVNGPDFAANYDLEMFVDARGEDTAGGREFRGGVQLDETRQREELTFDVLQTADQFYSPIAVAGRKTYRAGDLTLAVYGGERVRKIERVAVGWNVPTREDAFLVDVETREVAHE
jgi:hypothetical protein